MGYPKIADFDKTIIKRTKENLKNAAIKYDFTQLLNSLLGLIVVLHQMKVQGKRKMAFFEKKISDYKKLDFLKDKDTFNDEQKNQSFKEITTEKLIRQYIKYDKIKIEDLIECMRNGIVHYGIRPTKDGDDWEGIVIRNYTKDNQIPKWSDNYKFQIYLTQSELKELCILLTDEYLKELSSSS